MDKLRAKGRSWNWPPKFRKWGARERANFWIGMVFLLPWTIGFLVFTLYPMAASLVYSFSIYHPKAPLEWAGLQNYAGLLNDKLFWKSLYNTLYMVVIGVPVTLLVSFFCAVLLNLKVRGQSIYRVIYFLPSIVPTVASVILWLWILNPNAGILNTLLGYVGIQGPNWMSNPAWSKPGLILLGMWGMGGTIVIYLSGLQDVPTSLLEAAELDGANWWQRLWTVTVPMVSPITLFNLITGVIAQFQYFAQAYVFRGTQNLGYPLNSTLFYSVYLYQNAFLWLKMGYASAMAWVLFIIILICTILLLKVSERFTYYAG
ncbi:MAG: Lactose transport system permease protein LacF [Anaerolineales bacterium]|jgi:multiple sugar transport system permease protein|nr:Lactose transport system permease protein LacF [Anaerolineales bacterium]WKZ50728.1 MAG: sugar ABC transporter permease [Anaerolineales bacterium]